MNITPEELVAFADGQLDGEAKARIAAAIDADPDLQRQLAAHRALSARLNAHYAPIADEPVPDRLAQLLRPADGAEQENTGGVIDLAAARQRRDMRRSLPAWGWGGGAIAAALAAVLVFTVDRGAAPTQYADAQLAAVLDRQLVAGQPSDAQTRVLLSFRNESGEFCRAYMANDAGGIACRDADGWRQQFIGDAAPGADTEYRMAGSATQILQMAQEQAVDGALTAEEEAEAAANGWRGQ